MSHYFDSQEYLNIAKVIHSKASEIGDSEAVCRSVIGRCYYSAFLKVRDHLGLTHERGRDVHKTVEDCLKEVDFPAGCMLGELRKERNVADYQLEPRIGSTLASRSILLSDQIIQNLH